MFWTTRGKKEFLGAFFNDTGLPANVFMALITETNPPTLDTKTMGDLVEIAAGNGYTAGGFQLSRNATDFPNLLEDDTDKRASVGIKEIVWTPTGGTIPISGLGARWAVLTGPGVVVANRSIYAVFDLGVARIIPVGVPFRLNSGGLRFD